MKAFSVVATDERDTFDRDLTAGLAIQPIMPLSALPLCATTSSPSTPPAWRDRKLGWWAIAAGDDGGTVDAVLQYRYPMQPTFWFPALAATNQPALGTELPWLPSPSLHRGHQQGRPVRFAVSHRVAEQQGLLPD